MTGIASVPHRTPFVPREPMLLHDYMEAARAGHDWGRVELEDGYLIPMGPEYNPHFRTVQHLHYALGDYFGRDRAFTSGTLGIDDRTGYEPDVWVERADLAIDPYHWGIAEAPDCALVVEVSVTTERRDRNVKSVRYARAGIPECWIVVPNKVHVGPPTTLTRLTDPSPDGYQTSTEHEFPGLAIGFDATTVLGPHP